MHNKDLDYQVNSEGAVDTTVNFRLSEGIMDGPVKVKNDKDGTDVTHCQTQAEEEFLTTATNMNNILMSSSDDNPNSNDQNDPTYKK